MKLSTTLKTTALCLVLSAAATGTMLAYLTDTDTAENVFTIGSVSADLYENGTLIDSSFTGATLSGVYPTQVIPKKPTVKNTGTNPALVFIEVTIPKENIVISDAAGSKMPSSLRELFVIKQAAADNSVTNDDTLTHNNADWLKLDSATVNNADSVRYVFAYKKTLASGQETSAPFSHVRFVNAIEEQVVGSRSITVTADVIQQNNLTAGADPTSDELNTVFGAFSAQQS
ncbi:MAG: SipW-dependent-type signal peptide-containing protein [Eubacteriales bacterium]|nr:SipW-dependent-type signal peptide-containing protein [Eubacteriales bacterium]